jgi:hypothetical protein
MYNGLIMADDLIPDDVKQFILDKIDSVAELEGLLLLCSNPQDEWKVEALAQRLYINEQQTGDVLAKLHAEGFLSIKGGKSPSYRFQPNSEEICQIVDRVKEVYSKYLVPVTNLIHSKPKTNVQKFADAFRLRKDK